MYTPLKRLSVECMIIFLKNIPSETQKYEIADFIGRVMNACFLYNPNTKISLKDIEILSIRDVDSNALEKHGLVNVPLNEVGKKLIERLDGATFKGECIAVREYVNRSAHNDPRNGHSTDTTIDFKERRASDRRREPLINSWQKNPILVHRQVTC
jgi:hypothetical protein